MPSEAWLILLQAYAAAPRGWRDIVRSAGSPEAVLGLSAGELSAAGVRPEAIERLRHPDPEVLARWRVWLQEPLHALIALGTEQYPRLLGSVPDAPLALWIDGAKPELLQAPQLAMVGSRSPTRGGRDTAAQFARYLSERGLTITSGLAIGIDGASHEGALEGCGGTIAVLASGLDKIFPRSHQRLARQIATSGILVSEYAPGEPPRRVHFPRRNRIIAGVSLGTLVVEATRRSGSLITARLAAEYGRAVFAIPGSIHNPLARGCHELIRQGASLIEDATEVLIELAPSLAIAIERHPDDTKPGPEAGGLLDEPGYRELLNLLGFEPVSLTQIAARCGLTAEELSSMLLLLELEGFVEALPGGRYSRLANRSR